LERIPNYTDLKNAVNDFEKNLLEKTGIIYNPYLRKNLGIMSA